MHWLKNLICACLTHLALPHLWLLILYLWILMVGANASTRVACPDDVFTSCDKDKHPKGQATVGISRSFIRVGVTR